MFWYITCGLILISFFISFVVYQFSKAAEQTHKDSENPLQ
jgi:uncharacterized membrane protein